MGGDPIGIASWHSQGNQALKTEYNRRSYKGESVDHLPLEMSSAHRFALFLENLPDDVHYTGVDFPNRLRTEDRRGYKMRNTFISRSHDMLATYRTFQGLSDVSRCVLMEEMDGRNLTYGDDNFDEVHLHWVLDEPSVNYQDGFSMLQQARRVVKPQGNIIISGQRFRYDHKNMEILNFTQTALDLVTRAGLQVQPEQHESIGKDNTENHSGLNDATKLAGLVKGLYFHRKMMVDDRAGNHDAYLIVAKP